MTASTVSSLSQRLLSTLATLTLTLPPVIFLQDTFYSLYRVDGSSMEPALQHGDVLLVRKADIFPHRQWLRWTTATSSSLEEEEECRNALRVIAHDAQSGRPIGHSVTGYSYLKPPTVHQLGSVVVYRAPDAGKYPAGEYRVKRVVGLGGQIVRTWDEHSGRGQRMELVPHFALWVEGDNYGQRTKSLHTRDESEQMEYKHMRLHHGNSNRESVDSRTYGPISKNLVVGIAERVIWPPSRWSKISCLTSPVPRSWWP